MANSSTRRWSIDDELRVLEAAKKLSEAKRKLADLATRATELLAPRDAAAQVHDGIVAAEQRNQWLRDQIAQKKKTLPRRRRIANEANSFLTVRKNAYEQAKRRLAEDVTWLESSLEVVARSRDSLYQVLSDLYHEQAQVAQALIFTFPIATLDRRSFTIRSVPLPNSDYEERHDPIAVSAALGWIVHILQLLTEILHFPNRYHLTSLGSKSTIQDPVSKQVYPLFEQGTSPFAFEYGVFLLNNCIAEILEARGVAVNNLQMTLSNLQMLMTSIAQDHVDLAAHASPYTQPTSATTSSNPYLFPQSLSSHQYHHHPLPLGLLHLPPSLYRPLAHSPNISSSGMPRSLSTTPNDLLGTTPGSGTSPPSMSLPSSLIGAGNRSPGWGGGGGAESAEPGGGSIRLGRGSLRQSGGGGGHRRVAQSGEWRVVDGQLKMIASSDRRVGE
ncbi:hypothetical protein BCR44DRAFT_1446543 [Catenaria anguillulae PL171]|uniref:Autophagy-related protein 14 n=1 Tax=Catenaria anguillulae PL171 TaxID=765915 RepID=A0A1Y2H640_9FUNG|nr:hypothetical protein BCR44DRAFT_1446543 [Catenaria anguillulae PL171]